MAATGKARRKRPVPAVPAVPVLAEEIARFLLLGPTIHNVPEGSESRRLWREGGRAAIVALWTEHESLLRATAERLQIRPMCRGGMFWAEARAYPERTVFRYPTRPR